MGENMLATVESPYVWKIRPLTAEEVVILVRDYAGLLAAVIDASPTFPLPEDEVRGCLFNIFMEFPEFAGRILATANPPSRVLDNLNPKTAARVAIEILAETRSKLPDRLFDAIVVWELRHLSRLFSWVKN